MHKNFDFILKRIQSSALAVLCLLTASLILAFPRESFQAALMGLDIWLRTVFPALLPFFIASEIMIGTGLVDFLAVLLSPIMQPLFRCPGESSFIWAMSITSGYPVGAKITASFWEKGKITVTEAQRIIAYCSTSGPLFMLSAVGIGMLNSPAAGKVIAASHYIASIFIGLIFRFYIPSDEKKTKKIYPYPGIKAAFEALLSARRKDNRAFGEMLGDAVRNSVNTLLYIGGFIILFSVIINILIKIGFIGAVSKIVAPLLAPLGIHSNLLNGVISGMFEITTGCKLVSQATAPLFQKILLSTFIISWSGFSIHSQVMGFLSNTGISVSLYIITKLFHGILASSIAWGIMNIWPHPEFSVFQQFSHQHDIPFSAHLHSSWQLLLCSILSLYISAIISFIIIQLIKLSNRLNRQIKIKCKSQKH